MEACEMGVSSYQETNINANLKDILEQGLRLISPYFKTQIQQYQKHFLVNWNSYDNKLMCFIIDLLSTNQLKSIF